MIPYLVSRNPMNLVGLRTDDLRASETRADYIHHHQPVTEEQKQGAKKHLKGVLPP